MLMTKIKKQKAVNLTLIIKQVAQPRGIKFITERNKPLHKKLLYKLQQTTFNFFLALLPQYRRVYFFLCHFPVAFLPPSHFSFTFADHGP